MITAAESAELRGLVYSFPNSAFDREAPESHQAAEAIVEWFYLRPVARGDIRRTRELARTAISAELDRQHRTCVDELVRLVRGSDRYASWSGK